MQTNIIIAEFVIIGIVALYGINVVSSDELIILGKSYYALNLVDVVFIGSLAYAIGFVTNAFAEPIFNRPRRYIEEKEIKKYEKKYLEKLIVDKMRYFIYQWGSDNAVGRMEYHNSLLRVSRGICFVSIVFALFMLFILLRNGYWTEVQWTLFWIALGLLICSFYSFCRRVKWLTKTTIYSFGALRTKENYDWCITEIGKNEHYEKL